MVQLVGSDATYFHVVLIYRPGTPLHCIAVEKLLDSAEQRSGNRARQETQADARTAER